MEWKFSEFKESDKSMKHKPGSILSGYHVDPPITLKAEPSDRPAVRQIAI